MWERSPWRSRKIVGWVERSETHHLHHIAVFLPHCDILDSLDTLFLFLGLLLGFLLRSQGSFLFSYFGNAFLKIIRFGSRCLLCFLSQIGYTGTYLFNS